MSHRLCLSPVLLLSVVRPELSHFGPDTVGEITIRRQKPLVLRIMVEQGRTRILFLSGLTPRCEQIFPHRCCFQPVRRFRQRCPIGFGQSLAARSKDSLAGFCTGGKFRTPFLDENRPCRAPSPTSVYPLLARRRTTSCRRSRQPASRLRPTPEFATGPAATSGPDERTVVRLGVEPTGAAIV